MWFESMAAAKIPPIERLPEQFDHPGACRRAHDRDALKSNTIRYVDVVMTERVSTETAVGEAAAAAAGGA